MTPHTYLPTFHLRLHICKTAPVCGASKSLTRFWGNPNLAERKSNRWPYRSQWLSGALHPSRREKRFLDARHWHFLCRLIGIHHHHATFLHHHKDFQYCHCYKGVILAHYQHDLQHCLITLMLFFQSQTLTIWSCWVPTWQRNGINDKQSNIMIEFRWWRWWKWWCNDLPWKGVEYNRKMNIKAHRLSPAQPTSMKLNPRTFAL